MANNKKNLVSASQEEQIRTSVLEWLNGCPDKPGKIEYSFLGKTSGIALGTIQGAFKVAEYICGGYKAQYQFELVYRLIAENSEERIAADELLDSMAEWMEENPPEPPSGVNWWKAKRDNGSAHVASYDNGAEDHAIQITITYEVI